MRNEGGKSIVILVLLTILIMIGAGVCINYAKQMMAEKKERDLRTNMLLIQAETKKGLEEVCFRTVNMDETKEENITKINEIKSEYLKGTILSDAPVEVQEAIKNIPDVNFEENCYYLDEMLLNQMEIYNVSSSKYGYFIVKYDFSNADVEVINTNGSEGKYTLTQIVEELEENESEDEVIEEKQETENEQS